jgi:hemerythrin superfamily protein
MGSFTHEGPTMPTNKTAKDACDLLDADHRAVKKLFKEYEALIGSHSRTSVARKQELARDICTQLTVHAQIEEEIFYPALRDALRATDLLDEAQVEHQSAKDLIAQIESGDDGPELHDAKVKVLGEYIDHHVKEERNELFPKARTARGLDLVAMRAQLEARKAELLDEATALA